MNDDSNSRAGRKKAQALADGKGPAVKAPSRLDPAALAAKLKESQDTKALGADKKNERVEAQKKKAEAEKAMNLRNKKGDGDLAALLSAGIAPKKKK